MRDLRSYSKNELSLCVFNEEYFYVERGYPEYLIALVNEEFLYTNEQMGVLIHDLIDDATEDNT
jgi:hypothetical protein